MDIKAEEQFNKFVPNIEYDPSESIVDTFEKLAAEYMKPWSGFPGKPKARFTKRMLNTMEFAFKGGSFRVRIVDGQIYYRKIVRWDQTYRDQRMEWILGMLKQMIAEDRINFNTDLIFYVGDGCKVAMDTSIQEAGFPLFSLRTSQNHMDIPIPDPVAYGSNGQYSWPESAKNAFPFDKKIEKVIFRGKASCLKMQSDNWHVCNRVVASLISKEFPDLFDIGVIEWNQLKSTVSFYPNARKDEVEQSTGLKLVEFMDFEAQSRYKYILDLDGGLGSSRKPGILSSGSVALFQQSPWYGFFEPLLRPYSHYIPISRWLDDLVAKTVWIMRRPKLGKQITLNGIEFEKKYLSMDAAKTYMQIVLRKYTDLLVDQVDLSPVEIDYCLPDNKQIINGPMKCSRDWIKWDI